MTRFLHVLLFLVSATLLSAVGAQAQNLVTIKPGPKTIAWWLRADFHALDREIRGIPVAMIRPDWCKASEFKRELFPKNTLVEGRTDLLAPAKLGFALEGSFDGSGTKQVALVGTYETCKGVKGRFFLIIDETTRKVRFLDAQPSKDRFSAIGKVSGNAIQVAYCLECDIGAFVSWDRRRKKFVIK